MTAVQNGIRSMPTFVFYKNRKKVDQFQGADPTGLEDRINQWIGGAVDTLVHALIALMIYLYINFEELSKG